MDSSTKNLLRAFGSRICHDILSPIGALQIANENLLHEMGQKVELISKSMDAVFAMSNVNCKEADALRTAVESLLYEVEQKGELVSRSMGCVIAILDLERKGLYNSVFITEQDVRRLLADNFEDQLHLSEQDLDSVWFNDLLRLCIWIKYKISSSSKINVSSTESELKLEVDKVYVNQQELEILNGRQVEPDAHFIYLVWFVSSLTKQIAVNYEYSELNRTLSIVLTR